MSENWLKPCSRCFRTSCSQWKLPSIAINPSFSVEPSYHNIKFLIYIYIYIIYIMFNIYIYICSIIIYVYTHTYIYIYIYKDIHLCHSCRSYLPCRFYPHSNSGRAPVQPQRSQVARRCPRARDSRAGPIVAQEVSMGSATKVRYITYHLVN